MKKYHYYSHSFSFSDGATETVASVYVGYRRKNLISKADIDYAKELAGIDHGAVMIACCYLGRMTKEEMDTITRVKKSILDRVIEKVGEWF